MVRFGDAGRNNPSFRDLTNLGKSLRNEQVDDIFGGIPSNGDSPVSNLIQPVGGNSLFTSTANIFPNSTVGPGSITQSGANNILIGTPSGFIGTPGTVNGSTSSLDSGLFDSGGLSSSYGLGGASFIAFAGIIALDGLNGDGLSEFSRPTTVDNSQANTGAESQNSLNSLLNSVLQIVQLLLQLVLFSQFSQSGQGSGQSSTNQGLY